MSTVLRTGLSAALAAALIGAAAAAETQPPKPPLEIVSVTPTKVLFGPGEPITGTVTVKNHTPGAKTVTVRAYEDLPAPVRNVEVRLRGEAVKGWTVARATLLSPEPMLKEAVPVRPDGADFAMTVPDVVLWDILVIDLEK
jgi:hypothetical protein